MKVGLLNSFDSGGGAAIATYRLHCGLRSIGIDSNMMVMRKSLNDPSVIGADPSSLILKSIVHFARRRDWQVTQQCITRGNQFFSPARCPDFLAEKVRELNPDLLHLFWVNSGFMRIETLPKFKRPLVWTLHDMWPFTGGCHYDGGCGRFKLSCGSCPVLESGTKHDLSWSIFNRKLKSWQGVPVVVVATSHWLADMARASLLFRDRRIEVIPNGLDTEKYRPFDKEFAREVYGFPRDKRLILFSAFSATTDKRKGGQFLLPALQELAQTHLGKEAELVILGASRPQDAPALGMKVHYMGHFHDEISQALLYSAVDVTVAPSMQENLSNAVMESLSCGTPVVAFNIGGMPDMVEHRASGYLAKPFASGDLMDGLIWTLEDSIRHSALSRRARASVLERYTLEKVANRYRELYQGVLR